MTSTKQAFLDKIFNKESIATDNQPSDDSAIDDSPNDTEGSDSANTASDGDDSGSDGGSADRSSYDELEHTERTASDNPIYRASFWVFVVLLSSGALWWVASHMDFSSMANGGKNSYTTPVEEKEPEDEAIAADETEIQLAFSDQDVDQANATAFLDAEERAKNYENAQRKANKSANSTAANRPSPSPVSAANTVQAPRRPYVPVPRNTRRAYTPPKPQPARPNIRRPSLSPSPRPAQRTSPQPAQRVSPSPTITKPEVNSAQLYASFNEIGSYGQADWTNNGQQSSRPSSPIPSSNNFNPATNASDDGFLSGAGQDVYLVPGETLELQLNLPIFWSDSRPAPMTLATVTKGNQYLPAGTQLSVAANGDNSGLVQISQISIIDGNETIPLSGAMQITQPNGKPLKAKKKGGPSFFSKIGVKTLLGLGASVAGSALSGDTVTINNGATSVTQDKGILSNALQSGSSELLSELQSRSESSLDQQQSQVYFIVDSGKSITVSAVSNIGG